MPRKIQSSEKEKLLIFEQYKLAVEMSDHISSRREGTNRIYISVHTALSGFLAMQSNLGIFQVVVFLCGIILSIVWKNNIKSYKTLNSAKFQVINKIEEKLPYKVFGDEWEILKQGKDVQTHRILTDSEKWLPTTFLLLYLLLFVTMFVTKFHLSFSIGQDIQIFIWGQ